MAAVCTIDLISGLNALLLQFVVDPPACPAAACSGYLGMGGRPPHRNPITCADKVKRMDFYPTATFRLGVCLHCTRPLIIIITA